jgi:hypothetical protein
MIDISTAANTAEIIGGIAILVSLAYVGYQIRQSNRIARATALQSVLDGFSDRALAQSIEHPETFELQNRGHHCYTDLSRQEQVVFGGLINRNVFHMQNVMQFHDNGLISEVDFQAWLAFTVAEVTTPGGRECWNIMKASYTPTIVATIETYMKTNPSAPTTIDLYPHLYNSDAISH